MYPEETLIGTLLLGNEWVAIPKNDLKGSLTKMIGWILKNGWLYEIPLFYCRAVFSGAGIEQIILF